MVQRLRRELEENKSKCRELQKELESFQVQQETLLADKSADIIILRQQLLEKEKHLQAILSMTFFTILYFGHIMYVICFSLFKVTLIVINVS